MQLANAASFATNYEEFRVELAKLIEHEKIDLNTTVVPHIVVGRDSRESSPYFAALLDFLHGQRLPRASFGPRLCHYASIALHY